MRKFDENEMKIVKERVKSIKNLADQIKEVSLPEIEKLIGMLHNDVILQKRILDGGTESDPIYDFAKMTLKLDEELLFMLNWCVKGFEGIEKCSRNFVKSMEKGEYYEK